jgi:hypothetical protein
MAEPTQFGIEEEDMETWSALVVAWVKGEVPHPTTMAELVTQCNFEPRIPAWITSIEVIQNDRSVLTLRLPPRDVFNAAEASLGQGGPGEYKLPKFYDRFYSECVRDEELPAVERKKLLHLRVGEYVMNSCA